MKSSIDPPGTLAGAAAVTPTARVTRSRRANAPAVQARTEGRYRDSPEVAHTCLMRCRGCPGPPRRASKACGTTPRWSAGKTTRPGAAGAAGYVLKRQVDQDIIAACRAAIRGEPFIYPNALSALMRRYLALVDHGQNPKTGALTSQETEVVKLIAERHSSQEIADLLCISLKTVDRHRTNVLDKLKMNDRVQVTRYAIRTGLVEP